MSRLIDQVEFVIGVDTHKDSHTAALLSAQGVKLATLQAHADTHGYEQLLTFASTHAAGPRLWAIEGTGSYGRGLTHHLLARHEQVAEVDRPRRPARHNGAKSDALDAVRAARELLTRERLTEPRQAAEREALRVLLRTREGATQSYRNALCQLKALIVTAPDSLRAALRSLSTLTLLRHCARLRTATTASIEYRATALALQSIARRALSLHQEARTLEAHLRELTQPQAPELLAQPGIGALTAAQILCAWSHPHRLHSEAAFACLAGTAPLPASSGQTIRHRLSRRGDRRLNWALEMIVRCRLAHHQETRAYAARRRAEGKSTREIRRCLKRYLARRLYHLLEHSNPLDRS